MNLLELILLGFVWFLWLAISFRSEYKKVVLLVAGAACEVIGMYLIFQDGIRADEQGGSGNIFSNYLALSLIGLGFVISIALTVERFMNPKKQKHHPRALH